MVNWPTALAALKPLGRIAAGQTVLIHAAAGAALAPTWCWSQSAAPASAPAWLRRSGSPAGSSSTACPGGEAAITNWDLVYQHQIHVIGLNIGVLIQAAPQIFGEVMGELFALIAAGVPPRPAHRL